MKISLADLSSSERLGWSQIAKNEEEILKEDVL